MNPFIDTFLRQGKPRGWAEGTPKVYRCRLNGLLHWLQAEHGTGLTEVAPEHLDRYMRHMLRLGRKKNTRIQAAGTIRVFFSWLHERGVLPFNPALDMAVPDNGRPDLLPPPLEEHEVRMLIDNIPRHTVVDLRNRCHLELLYGCGLRVSESVGLNLDDLDLAHRTLRVRGTIGKNGKTRVLPVMRGAYRALKNYLALRRRLLKGRDHAALFVTNRGGRVSSVTFRDWLKKHARRHGKHVNPHQLRHAIAVHLLRGGMDVRCIQEFLGHSNINITKIYLRLVPGRIKEEYERCMPIIAVAD